MTTRAPHTKASNNGGEPEEAPAEQVSVTVHIAVDEEGNARVGDITGEGGITMPLMQFWLEEGIQHLRRVRGLT